MGQNPDKESCLPVLPPVPPDCLGGAGGLTLAVLFSPSWSILPGLLGPQCPSRSTAWGLASSCTLLGMVLLERECDPQRSLAFGWEAPVPTSTAALHVPQPPNTVSLDLHPCSLSPPGLIYSSAPPSAPPHPSNSVAASHPSRWQGSGSSSLGFCCGGFSGVWVPHHQQMLSFLGSTLLVARL